MGIDVFEVIKKKDCRCMKCGEDVRNTMIWWCASTELFEIDKGWLPRAKINWWEDTKLGDGGVNDDWINSILLCKECMEDFLGYVALKK